MTQTKVGTWGDFNREDTEDLGLFLLIRCAQGGGIAEWEKIVPPSKEQKQFM